MFVCINVINICIGEYVDGNWHMGYILQRVCACSKYLVYPLETFPFTECPSYKHLVVLLNKNQQQQTPPKKPTQNQTGYENSVPKRPVFRHD